LRFTASEIQRHEGIGLDLNGVRSVDQFARAVEFWALVMAEVRPDIVQKLERMLRDRLASEQSEAEASPDVSSACQVLANQTLLVDETQGPTLAGFDTESRRATLTTRRRN
jgi:hypothetical protein